MRRPTLDLSPLIDPRSVAVVGASAQGGRATGAVRNLKELGFSGSIYPVNPKYKEVLGLACYPTLAEIPGPVDLVCLGIPSEHVQGLLDEAHQKGARAAVIFASGYAEADASGSARQRELEAFADRTGMLICGPNCLGVINLARRSCGYSSASPALVKSGGIGLVSQSGTIVVAMIKSVREFGFSHMISSGNESVVTTADYLDHFVDDPATKILVSYIEGIRNPAKFIAASERARHAGKPLIVVKSGRSEGGGAASAAHTGALAGSYEVQSAVFRQKGIIQCDDFDEMTEAIEMFSFARPAIAKGIGIIGISGGENAIVVDHATDLGLPVPALSDAGRSRLAKLLPWFARAENPLDLTGAALDNAELYVSCIEVLAAERDVGVIVVSQDSPAAYDVAVARYIVAATKRTNKCLVFCNNFSGPWNLEILRMLREVGVPYLQGIREGLKAVKAFVDHHHRSNDASAAGVAQDAQRRALAISMMAGSDRLLTEDLSKRIIALYDLPVSPEALVHDRDEATSAAASFGYPVVMKIVSPDIAHKAAAGGVRLDIRSPAELATAWDELANGFATAAADARVTGTLVQPMVKPRGAIEIILGVKRDVQFGPIVMFGLGGIFTEALQQVALRMAPLTPRDAAEMILEVPAFQRLCTKLHPGRDVNALVVDLLLKVSALANDLGEHVEEIDMNPVILDPEAQAAVIVDALIVPVRESPF